MRTWLASGCFPSIASRAACGSCLATSRVKLLTGVCASADVFCVQARNFKRTAQGLSLLLLGMVLAQVAHANGDERVYKANVNSVCAKNTPSFARYIAALLTAERVKNETAVGINLGLLLRLMQQQNQQLYGVTIPSSARTPMAPILKQLHAEDSAVTGIFTAMLRQNTAQLTERLSALGTIFPTLRTLFNGYRLTACGSQPLLR